MLLNSKLKNEIKITNVQGEESRKFRLFADNTKMSFPFQQEN